MRVKKNEFGQSLVEFALILPILMLLLLGIFEGGRIIQSYISAQNASRLAARFAVAGLPLLDDNGDVTEDTAQGVPSWEMQPVTDRADIIKNVAIVASRGTGFSQVYSDTTQYNSCATGSDATCAGVLGIWIGGQTSIDDANNGIYQPNDPGIQGLNVKVDVYHNVAIWDPIYGAIAPGGFVRVSASTIMRNEGVDVSIVGTPVGLGGTPTPPPFGQGTPPVTGPDIDLQEGSPVQVGQPVTILVVRHNAGNYDICFAGQWITTLNITADGSGVHPYVIPSLPARPDYHLQSFPASGGTCSGTATADRIIAVALSDTADIAINEDSPSPIWPFGSPLTYRLINHPVDSSFQVYVDGSAAGLETLATGADGSSAPSTSPYIIPNPSTEGVHLFTTDVATKAVDFVRGCIKVDQEGCNNVPVEYPNRVPVRIHLEKHAFNREYSVRFVDPDGAANGGDFSKTIAPSIVTDGTGQAFDILFTLPDAPNNNPATPYLIQTFDGVYPIASKAVNINTPAGPFIVVEGGYKWAAGSNIVFHLREHESDTRYDIYWDGTQVITSSAINDATDANGEVTFDYDIPASTVSGNYWLTSRPNPLDAGGHPTSIHAPDYGRSIREIEVTGVPYIEIVEGNPQVPGSTITLRLAQHNANTQYDLYIVVNSALVKIPGSPVGTNSNGETTLKYVIPTTLSPGTDYPIRSYPRGNTTTMVAETTLQLAAPDLWVKEIVAPANPTFNVPIPITLTVENRLPVTITHTSFDLDIYIDPPIEPDLGRALPPGDVKLWLQPPFGANETRVITATIALYGSFDHDIWGRVDTSGRVVETIETNNKTSIVVQPATCQVELTTSTLNQSHAYGDADNASFNVSGDTITLRNNGTGASENNDNSGGYFYVYQQLSGDFDVRVRAVSQDPDEVGTLDQFAYYGLEVREVGGGINDPTADKVQWGRSAGQRLLYLRRQNGNIGPGDTASGLGPNTTNPVWLRIVKSGPELTLYWADNSINPPTTWNPVQTLVTNALADEVYLGIMNTSLSSQRDLVTLDKYHVCGNPGGSCGPVREAGGQIIINASNYVENIAINNFTANNGTNYGTKKWEATTNSGLLGMVAPNQTGDPLLDQNRYVTDSPQLRYEVDVTNPGTYYVWFLVHEPGGNNSDSLHFGLTNDPPPGNRYWGNDSMAGSDDPDWTNNRPNYQGTKSVTINQAGQVSLSVWMREDGFELYQILLTQDSGFDPSGQLDLQQSQCANAGVPPSPPGLQQCTDLIVNGNFEDDALMSEWNYSKIAQQVTRTSVPHWLAPGESFSMLLPDTTIAGVPRSPWLWQEVTMPSWIITPTVNGGTQINLRAHVGVNQEGVSNPEDELLVSLLDASGAFLVTAPISLSNGAQVPEINPTLPNNNQWILKTVNLANAISPPEDLLNYRDQDLRLLFEAPNLGGDSTRFYLENVALDVCTVEPTPASFDTKVSGAVRVLIDGIPTPKPGVFVWIYAIDGQMQKTYSIHDSTFSFYNLPATPTGTTYVLYAEYIEDGNFYSTSTILVLRQGQSIENVALLLF
jgi:hypothetical protein